jgi:hypothetical protein
MNSELINARQKFTVLLIIGSIGSLALTYLLHAIGG